jgi:hypothetical protein
MSVSERLKDASGFVDVFVRGVTQDLDADVTRRRNGVCVSDGMGHTHTHTRTHARACVCAHTLLLSSLDRYTLRS